MTISPKAKKVFIFATLGVLAILAILLLVRIGLPRWSSGKAGRISPTPTPSPVPTPTPLPIAPGRQVYNIQSDTKTPGPAVSEATFDPLDVSKGGKITVSVKAKDTRGITSLAVMVIHDAGKALHDLILTGGTKNDGIWSGSWIAESTHNRIYAATIEATNTKREKRSIELWFR